MPLVTVSAEEEEGGAEQAAITKADWKNTILYFFTPAIDEMCKKFAARDTFRVQFEGAGKRLGLHIWRIERFIPVPWRKHGKFHKGDSYIVLNTLLLPEHLSSGTRAEQKQKKASIADVVLEDGDDCHADDASNHANDDSSSAGSPPHAYDVHFWVGEGSTEDEYGAAALKAMELDALLRADGTRRGVVHREIQDFESEQFLSYFSELGLAYLEGGVDGVDLFGNKAALKTGSFAKPKAIPAAATKREAELETRLFQIKGRKGHLLMTQVPLSRASMNTGDVFVLDAPEAVYQWNGSSANDDEVERGVTLCRTLMSERGSSSVITLAQGEEQGSTFLEHLRESEQALGHKLEDVAIRAAEDAGDDDDVKTSWTPVLFRASTSAASFAAGPLRKVSGGGKSKPLRAHLKTSGIYLIDMGVEINMWIGKDASEVFRQKVFPFATLYTRRFKRPMVLPVHVYCEGEEDGRFLAGFASEQEAAARRLSTARLSRASMRSSTSSMVEGTSNMARRTSSLFAGRLRPSVSTVAAREREPMGAELATANSCCLVM